MYVFDYFISSFQYILGNCTCVTQQYSHATVLLSLIAVYVHMCVCVHATVKITVILTYFGYLRFKPFSCTTA